MIRLAVSVEGRTEEEFVRSVLAPYLRFKGVEPTPVRIGRAIGQNIGGGDVTIERLTADMVKLYWTHDAVTSLVDFYGFQGKEGRTVDELEHELNQRIQESAAGRWDQRRVIPYVQRHEFEGLLFSDANAFGITVADISEQATVQLSAVRSRFQTPEDINDDPNTAPSKRIMSAIPGYRKRLHGPEVAREIGLDAIRGECLRFDGWLTRLEDLGEVL